MATPFPFLRSLCKMSTDRVEDHVSAELQQIAFFIDNDCFVSTLEYVAGFLMSPVVPLGVDSIQLSHAARKVSFRCFDNEVIVGVHETVGVAQPVKPFYYCSQKLKKIEPVLIGSEYSLSCIAPGSDVIECAGVFYSEGTGHKKTLSREMCDCKT